VPTATPTFSVPPGTYDSWQTVTISDATAGATIYYTTDGTTPGTTSTKYTDAIAVDSTETLKAIATASKHSFSDLATASYTIPIELTLGPSSASVGLGGTQVFTATISNATNTGLKWYVNGVLNGNSAQGTLTACTTAAPWKCTYTAPPVNVPSPNPAVIEIASVENSAYTQSADVTVTDPIEVTLSPTSKTLALGATQVFTATITGATSNSALKWYVNGVLNGNATQGKLTACTTVVPLTCTYTAPPVDVPSPNPAVITVASDADPGKNKTASVTVTDTIAVTLSPSSKSLEHSGAQVFTATISNTTDTALDWYVNGVLNGNAAQGLLTGTGLTRTYTAPPAVEPSPNPAVIEVASVADPTKFKTASVTVAPAIAVTLSPASKTLATGGTQVFTATISNTTNTTLDWYVNGVLNGSAAQGKLTGTGLTRTYTAPSAVPSPNPAVIKAASVADPTKFETANVTVIPIVVTLSPSTKSLALGGTQVFTATITGTTDTALDWYVNGVLNGNAAQGTLTACTTVAPWTCTYTAPPVDVPPTNPVVIKVVSVADTSIYKTASVTVTDSIVLGLSPASASVALGGTQLFTATISNTTDTRLFWYVNGVRDGNSTQGTLTGCTLVAPRTCLYTAPTASAPSPNPAIIKVESFADQSKSKTASVTVTGP
jgi:hypothetical protein